MKQVVDARIHRPKQSMRCKERTNHLRRERSTRTHEEEGGTGYCQTQEQNNARELHIANRRRRKKSCGNRQNHNGTNRSEGDTPPTRHTRTGFFVRAHDTSRAEAEPRGPKTQPDPDILGKPSAFVRVGSSAVLGVREFTNDRPCQMLIYFTMPRNRLANFRLRILIPVMLPTVTDKNGTLLLNLPDQIATLHATSSSE